MVLSRSTDLAVHNNHGDHCAVTWAKNGVSWTVKWYFDMFQVIRQERGVEITIVIPSVFFHNLSDDAVLRGGKWVSAMSMFMSSTIDNGN